MYEWKWNKKISLTILFSTFILDLFFPKKFTWNRLHPVSVYLDLYVQI